MSETPKTDEQERSSRTRALFEQLASTQHRRRLTADRIFRQLRRGEDVGEPDAG